MNENAKKALALLDSAGIEYQLVEHESAATMDALVAIDEKLGVRHCRNLLLCTRTQTAFFFMITGGDTPFRTAVVSKLLGVSRLSFAPEDKVTSLLDAQSGSLSPLCLANDTENKVTFVIEKTALAGDTIAIHPCDCSATVLIKTDEFLAKLPAAVGHEPVFISVAESSEYCE